MSRTIMSIIDDAIDATMRLPLRDWNWSEGVALYGLMQLNEQVQQEKVMPFIQSWVDRQLESGHVHATVNATAPCMALLPLHERNPESRYVELINSRMHDLLNEAPRLSCGAFEHTLVETKFGGQLWIDTLYMAGLFLTRAGKLLSNEHAFEEGMLQYRLHVERLQAVNGLFYHGWSERKEDVIGCQWARGNAWAAAVSVDMLELLKERPEFRNYVQSTLDRQLIGLQETQDPSGLWTTVLTAPKTYLETSAAAGIAYAAAKALRLGFVSESYKPMAERAIRAVLGNTDWDGHLRGVSSGTGVQNHPGEYHVIARDRVEGYGQGLLLLMLSEAVQWKGIDLG